MYAIICNNGKNRNIIEAPDLPELDDEEDFFSSYKQIFNSKEDAKAAFERLGNVNMQQEYSIVKLDVVVDIVVDASFIDLDTDAPQDA